MTFTVETKDLLQTAPPSRAEHQKRIEFMAKMLAYGAVNNRWSPEIAVLRRGNVERWYAQGHQAYSKNLGMYLEQIWKSNYPPMIFLEAFHYVNLCYEDGKGRIVRTQGDDRSEQSTVSSYMLTPKAFSLLDAPAQAPNVFISHRQAESSAFALLVYWRLKHAGARPFIDKDLRLGDDWETFLQKTIQSSQYFVALLTPHAWEKSPMLEKEYRWAKDAGVQMLPVWHNGLSKSETLPLDLSRSQAYIVEKENALHYDIAVDALLTRLGYAVHK